MNIDFKGYDEKSITLLAGSTLKVGDTVTMSGDSTVVTGVENGFFVGVCTAIRGKYATVQTSGYVKVKTAEKLAPGYKPLLANGNGGVVKKDTGMMKLVLTSTNTEAGILL